MTMTMTIIMIMLIMMMMMRMMMMVVVVMMVIVIVMIVMVGMPSIFCLNPTFPLMWWPSVYTACKILGLSPLARRIFSGHRRQLCFHSDMAKTMAPRTWPVGGSQGAAKSFPATEQLKGYMEEQNYRGDMFEVTVYTL
jgi:hypothetical protein